MAPSTRKRIDPISDRLLMDLQSYIFHAGDAVKFADIVSDFPGTPPLSLISALAELEKRTVISFTIHHNALHVKK